ncbi:hypothetical protein [Pseudomonas costantinii]|uniref:Uncharacterized protein n=1 Tax=Pseudomonas costantinii TaxID=168469 RepID=A0A1S2UY76_9PSED|nr:hypothetical protein [Pseudomonas costantinii]NVZ68138.1 hypothetical protein [Pseudomonas costantinii]OIN51383.1 hypothetical protein BFL40_17900 [Pseudomonas costantinii]SED96309.1 hypothetical protein SAMN04515675_3343 [Pseudomonas costantinii]
MELTHVIVPKTSIGGVTIGENISKVQARLSGRYKTENGAHSLTIENGLITAYHDADGIISALSCNADFKGNFENRLWPGMTVADVLKHSRQQVAWSGFVQIDQISGVGLSLPEECDDFDALTDHLDLDFVFNELWVYVF